MNYCEKFHPGKSRQFPLIEPILTVFEYAIYGKEAREFAMLHINCKRFSAHDQQCHLMGYFSSICSNLIYVLLLLV